MKLSTPKELGKETSDLFVAMMRSNNIATINIDDLVVEAIRARDVEIVKMVEECACHCCKKHRDALKGSA